MVPWSSCQPAIWPHDCGATESSPGQLYARGAEGGQARIRIQNLTPALALPISPLFLPWQGKQVPVKGTFVGWLITGSCSLCGDAKSWSPGRLYEGAMLPELCQRVWEKDGASKKGEFPNEMYLFGLVNTGEACRRRGTGQHLTADVIEHISKSKQCPRLCFGGQREKTQS